MAACEKYATRAITDSESPSAELVYRVYDAESEVAAYAELAALPIPSSYTFPSGKVATLNAIGIREIAESASGFTYEATLSFSTYEPKQANDVDYEFEAGAQSVTLTHATATTAFTGGGRTAPDFKRGINVSADGKIQGISVDRPRFSFSVTKYWPVASVTTAYQLIVAGLVGKVNNATYYGLAAGSVRFLGARGRIAGDKFPVTYRFEFSPNESGVSVGDISSISRTGWQYLDVYRHTVVDDNAKKKTEVPHSVYVHTVYDPGDFSTLGV
ncbi:MAG: hypothetical protein KDA45_07285 [Planctomycetales bacterium]|nr:hypothetical protein [Planctomycetales bacterium]